MPALPANARKQQEEDVERLVKCRLRSEIEARKAVESTMKRAVQEARELKKELVLLRQEKEELRIAAQKNALSAAGKETARRSSRDNQTSSNKAVELKLRQQIQTLIAQKTELETDSTELQQRVANLELKKEEAASQWTAQLKDKDHEIAGLRDELRKTRGAAEETKRKCQKMLKEKKEEAQRALQENEQLARCTKTLQGQLALLPQLKRQLEHAKAKRADAAEVWQAKLEQRDQAFLREEEASKLKLAESVTQIAELTDERESLQAKLEELERKIHIIDASHQAELRHEEQRLVELEGTTKQLRKELLAAESATREAEEAEMVAKETQEQETRLRQLAEDAADAVEARAEKAERDLTQAQAQLGRLEEALTARGVTLDFLLKQQTPVFVGSRTPVGKGLSRTASTLKKTHSTRARGSVATKPAAKARASSRSSNNEDERDRWEPTGRL